MTDNDLWRRVRDAAAVIGWGSRDAVIFAAMDRIAPASDDEREALRGRLDRLWIERAEISGPV